METPYRRDTEEFFRRVLAIDLSEFAEIRDLSSGPEEHFLWFIGVKYVTLAEQRTSLVQFDIRNGSFLTLLEDQGEILSARVSTASQRIAVAVRRDDEHSRCEVRVSKTDGSSARTVGAFPGIVESIQWRVDGRKLLLLVAGPSADTAGLQGGNEIIRSAPAGEVIEYDCPRDDGRRAWLVDPQECSCEPISPPGLNVWEVCWCGKDNLAVIASTATGEDSWYNASVYLVSTVTAKARKVYEPQAQLGCLAATSSGSLVAVVDSFCSDRKVVAGEARVIDLQSDLVRPVRIQDADVTCLAASSDESFIFASQGAVRTKIGRFSSYNSDVEVLWQDDTCTSAGWYPTVYPLPGPYCLAFLRESYSEPPCLTILDRAGAAHAFPLRNRAPLHSIIESAGAMSPVAWRSRDGVSIQGWLICPTHVRPPFPVVMDIHGGPVSAHRNVWLGKQRTAALLAANGIATFLPNPRGSGLRGKAFAELVRGDMGGHDADDLLSGLDHLVELGIAQENQLAITGISYGGFMSAWLVSQTTRFGAAVPISPVSNWYSQHWTSNIPSFDELFLACDPSEPGNRYHTRSPVTFGHRVRTQVLLLTGGLDRSTPPAQAVEFYNAVRRAGNWASLIVYPQSGHGIRTFPDHLDAVARTFEWCTRHLQVKFQGNQASLTSHPSTNKRYE